MSWPTPQDYNEAMQAPWLNLKDSALQSGKPALDFLGLPRPMTGAFASVYKLECGGRVYAIKLFLRNVPDQQARYAELSSSINSKELENTVGFQYQPLGISIRGKDFPLLRMDWAYGDNLDRYIEDHLEEPGSLAVLLHHFRQMLKNLHKGGVAHGDLQHGNILVNNGELKLVDYDGMYVPRLKGMRSNELGHPNFQHPGRSGEHFGAYLDNFSAWSIQTALLSVSIDPSVWKKLNAGDDCLLFRREDYEKPEQSDAFKLLSNHESEAIRTQVKLLRHMLNYAADQVPSFDDGVTSIDQLPQVVSSQAASVWQVHSTALSEKASVSHGVLPDSSASTSTFDSGSLSGLYTGAPVTFVTETNSNKWSFSPTPQPVQLPQKPFAASSVPQGQLQTFNGSAFPDWMQNTALPEQSNNSPRASIIEPVSIQHPLEPEPIRELNTTSAWPRFDQYRQALAEPDFNFADPELKLSRLIPETKGLGTNGFVFHMRSPNRHIAVKCFKEYVPDRQQRYEAIKKYVNSDARRYFIDFVYEPAGIRVGNYWYPTLKMEWLTPTLGEYINTNMRNKSRLAALSDKFHNLVQALHTLGIAHGDLEPDNIMVVSGDLKLIDYDGMYLPELDGFSGIELGHPAFQHPGRQPHHYGPRLDYFSAWILDAELSYLKVDPTLWVQAEIRSQAAVAKTSRGVQDASFLDMHPSKSVRHTGDVWRKLLDYDIDSIPKFDPRSPIFTLRTN